MGIFSQTLLFKEHNKKIAKPGITKTHTSTETMLALHDVKMTK